MVVMVEKRKRSPNVPRSEAYGLRLDPKLRYLAEITARKERRALAAFIEWAMEQAIKAVPLDDSDTAVTAYSYSDRLWHIEEADRLVMLAHEFPGLLNYEEQLIWRVVDEYSIPTTLKADQSVTYAFKQPSSSNHNQKVYRIELIRSCWPEIKRFALEKGAEKLRNELNAAIKKHSNE